MALFTDDNGNILHGIFKDDRINKELFSN